MTSKGIIRDDIESDLLFAARLVDEHGDVMKPILDRCEREYAGIRKPPEVERIRKLIADARRDDGLPPSL